MNEVSRTARNGVLVYRLTAIASLALAFVLFISSSTSTMTRVIVFVAWMALCVFTCIRTVGDALSGAHLKAQRFDNTIKAFEENTGSHEAAVKNFYVMIVVSSVIKLAVPVVLWSIFR